MVVVVVLTVCLDDVSVHAKRQAPNYGGRVPVDATPGPAPVCRSVWWWWWWYGPECIWKISDDKP